MKSAKESYVDPIKSRGQISSRRHGIVNKCTEFALPLDYHKKSNAVSISTLRQVVDTLPIGQFIVNYHFSGDQIIAGGVSSK